MGRGACGARRPRPWSRSSSSRCWPPARSSGWPTWSTGARARPGSPGALALLALLALLYAWRFGLHPRLVADDDGVHVRNPFSSRSFAWSDITLVAPGENGLVIGSDDEVVEAWCVQKSNVVDRAGAVHPGRRRRPRAHRRPRAARPAARGPRDRAAHPPRASGRGPAADPHRAGRQRGAPRAPLPARGVPLPRPRGHDPLAPAAARPGRPRLRPRARGRRRGARPRRLHRRGGPAPRRRARTAPGSGTARHSWSSPFVRSTTAASPRAASGSWRATRARAPSSAATAGPRPSSGARAATRRTPRSSAWSSRSGAGRAGPREPPAPRARPPGRPGTAPPSAVGARPPLVLALVLLVPSVAATLLRVLAPTDDTGAMLASFVPYGLLTYVLALVLLLVALVRARRRARARGPDRRGGRADRPAPQLAGAVLRARPPPGRRTVLHRLHAERLPRPGRHRPDGRGRLGGGRRGARARRRGRSSPGCRPRPGTRASRTPSAT